MVCNTSQGSGDKPRWETVLPYQGVGGKKEETKGVEPYLSFLTNRGGNHLDTLTPHTHNPMTRNQNFSPETPQGITILGPSLETPHGMNHSDPSPVTPHGKILLDFSPETPQEIIPGVTSKGASGETSQKVSTETSKNR